MTNLVVRLEEGSTGGGIECALDCLELRCHRQEELPRLLALCLPAVFKRAEKSREQGMKLQLEADVRVTWRGGPLAAGGTLGAAGAAAAVVAAAADEEEAALLLAPLHVSADLDMTLTFPAAAEARLQPPMLALSGRLDVGELAVRLSLAQLAALARMAHAATHAAHHERYRALRPACVPRDGPRRWWRYAHAAVALDLRQERERLSWRWLRTRAQLLRSYEARYEERLLQGGDGKEDGQTSDDLDLDLEALEARPRTSHLAPHTCASTFRPPPLHPPPLHPFAPAPLRPCAPPPLLPTLCPTLPPRPLSGEARPRRTLGCAATRALARHHAQREERRRRHLRRTEQRRRHGGGRAGVCRGAAGRAAQAAARPAAPAALGRGGARRQRGASRRRQLRLHRERPRRRRAPLGPAVLDARSVARRR